MLSTIIATVALLIAGVALYRNRKPGPVGPPGVSGPAGPRGRDADPVEVERLFKVYFANSDRLDAIEKELFGPLQPIPGVGQRGVFERRGGLKSRISDSEQSCGNNMNSCWAEMHNFGGRVIQLERWQEEVAPVITKSENLWRANFTRRPPHNTPLADIPDTALPQTIWVMKTPTGFDEDLSDDA